MTLNRTDPSYLDDLFRPPVVREILADERSAWILADEDLHFTWSMYTWHALGLTPASTFVMTQTFDQEGELSEQRVQLVKSSTLEY